MIRYKRVGRQKKFLGVTEIKMDGGICCPLCNRVVSKHETKRHHVIPEARNGHNGSVNVLRVCSTCHMVLHYGCDTDGDRLHRAALAFMGEKWGLRFLLQVAEIRTAARDSIDRSGAIRLNEFRTVDWAMRTIMSNWYREIMQGS